MTIPDDPNLVVGSDLPRESLDGGQPYVMSVEGIRSANRVLD